MIVAQLCEYAENHRVVHFKWMNLWYVNSISVKLCEYRGGEFNFDPDTPRFQMGGISELALDRQIFQMEKYGKSILNRGNGGMI